MRIVWLLVIEFARRDRSDVERGAPSRWFWIKAAAFVIVVVVVALVVVFTDVERKIK